MDPLLPVGVEPPAFDVPSPPPVPQDPVKPLVTEEDRRLLGEAAKRAAAERRERDKLLQEAVASTTSAEAAKARKLADDTGLPIDLVAQEPQAVEDRARARALDMQKLRKTHPGLAAQMEDAWFARIAQDDVENLKESESLIGWIGDQFSWVGRQLKSGFYDQQAQGYLGLLESAGRGSPEISAQLAELDKSLSQDGRGWIGGGLSVVGQVAATVPIPLAVGAATSAVTTPVGGLIAGTGTALTINSALEAGRQYHQMRLRGIPHEDAVWMSRAGGVGVGTLDTIGQFIGAKVFGSAASKLLGKGAAAAVTDVTIAKARGEFVKNYLKILGSESITETGQAWVSWAAQQQALRSANFSTDKWSTAGDQMWDAFSQTVQSMALVAGLGPAANHIATMRKARYVENRAEFFNALGEQTKANTFAKTAPSAHEEFIAKTAGKHGVDTAYVQADKLAEVLAQMDDAANAAGTESASASLEKKIPGITDQILAAAKDGGDVALPLDKIVRTDQLYEGLKPHMRLDPSEPSFAEVEEVKERHPDIVKDLESQIDDRAAFNDAADKFEQKLLSEAKSEVGRVGADVTDTQVRTAVALARRMYERLADEQGKTVAELKPLQFGPKLGADTLQQGETIKPDPEKFYRGFQTPGEVDGTRHMDKGRIWNDPFVLEMDGDDGVTNTGANDTFRGKIKPDRVKRIFVDVNAYAEYPADYVAELRAKFPNAEVVDVRLTDQEDGFVRLRQEDERVVRAEYDVANNRITLDKTTNVTSLMHEITHSVWNMALAIPERSPGFQKDIDAMFNWMGVTEEQWKAMTPAEREPHQEKVARAGELYFATGKAPTVELQSMFDRIAKWFRDIYRDIVGRINAAYRQQFGTDLPALTPEVRQFFDHLLAAEDTIANAEAIRGRVAAFEDRASFPGTDAEWTEYQAMVQARREGGVASLSAEVQKNLAWLQRSRDRVSKEVAAEARKLREAAGEEARGDVENQNVYRLRTWLKTGKKAGEKVHKLSIADVKSILGVEAQDYLKALEDHVTEDGWSVDAVAEDFGYDTGEQMLRELLDAPTKADAIENRIDEIMLRDHGTLRNAEEQAMAIEEALNNENASRLAYATLRFAQKIKSPDRLTKAAVHEAARLRLEAMPVRKIRAHSFSVSAAKLERQAAEAFKGKKASKTKGGVERAAKAPDPEEGIRLLQQSLLNTEMARQALKIERAVAKEAEKAKRFFQSDKKLFRKFNLDWVNVGRAILSGFSFGGNRSKLPLEYMASLAEYDPLLHARLDTYVNAATGGNTLQDYRDLPLQEFRDLTDSLDMLWTRAQRERQVEVEGKLVDKEEAKKQIAEILAPRISADGPTTPVPLNGLDRKDGWVRTQLGHLAKVEHTLRYLDGGKANGPMQRYFWTTLRKALDRYHLERGGYLTTLNKELDALHRDGLLGTTTIDLRQFLGEDGGLFQNTAHLLGALIHMGNQSNLQNLLLGYEWGTMDGPEGQKVLNTARWDAALQHLADKGTIKKQHIDFLQKIGKVNEGLKEAAQRVNKEVYGAYFEEVEIKPIKTPWGTYDGWYAPSPIDHDNPANTLAFLEKNGDNPAVTTVRDMVRNSPGVPHNWTIARVGGVKPRLLDLTKSAMHFDEMLRFIHLQIPLRDVWSLATDPEINAMLEAVAPGFVQNTLKPMLDDTGLGSMNKASMAGPMLGRVMSLLTRNTSRAFMAFSIRNYLQQFTGVAAIVPYTGLAHAWGGVRAVFALGGPGAAREFIESKSDFFKARQQEHQGTQLEEMRTLLDPTWKGKLDKVVDKVAFGMIGMSQRGADYVAWIAGYNKWLAEHPNDEAGAVTAGDSTVRLSQGSRTTMDTARIERGSPEMKLFTQFTHYWLNMAQQIAKTDRRAAAIFWAAIVPTMAGAAIAAALSGGKEFEDKDEEFAVNKLGWWLVNNPIRGGASMVPVVGPVVGQILTGQGGSLSMFPAQSVLEAAFRTARNLGDNLRYIAGSDDMEARVARSPTGATSGRGLRDLGLAISGLTGVPVKKVFEALGYLEDRADRRTERNWVSGLLGEGR